MRVGRAIIFPSGWPLDGITRVCLNKFQNRIEWLNNNFIGP